MTRADFIRICSGSMIALTEMPNRKKSRLSFSTLGCPDWPIEKIVAFAAGHGYEGVEIRGIQRQIDLVQSPCFSSPEAVASTRRRFSDAGLKFAALGSSTELHHADAATRRDHMDHGRQFIDLAHALDCPYVRVFPNKIPQGENKPDVITRIASGLNELGSYAHTSGVKVLMETHGDLVASDDVAAVMNAVDHANTGLVWDVANMWSVTRESPADVFRKLKRFILHTHIKDLRVVNGNYVYELPGRGEVPIFDAVDLMRRDGYNGYFSFEWEKLWHPDIADPEIALADYPIAMRKHVTATE